MGRNPSSSKQGSQFLLFCLFMEDPIFEKWLMNPTMYTLADYLMRGKQQLSNLASFVKWKGERSSLGLHADGAADQDDGMPSCGDTCNSAWALTGYTLDDGAIAMVARQSQVLPSPAPRPKARTWRSRWKRPKAR